MRSLRTSELSGAARVSSIGIGVWLLKRVTKRHPAASSRARLDRQGIGGVDVVNVGRRHGAVAETGEVGIADGRRHGPKPIAGEVRPLRTRAGQSQARDLSRAQTAGSNASRNPAARDVVSPPREAGEGGRVGAGEKRLSADPRQRGEDRLAAARVEMGGDLVHQRDGRLS